MTKTKGRRRRLSILGLLLPCILIVCPCALGLNPALDVNQYAHTAWKIRDGFPKGQIFAIAQTSDGYLWLGTEFGLLRFDGVRAVPWQQPPDEHLPSDYIMSLLAGRDGTLWIGTSKGLASWKDGKLTLYAELVGQYIYKLLEDHERTIWAGAGADPSGRLCAIQNASINCYGEDGSLGRAVNGLYEDSRGNLWVGVTNGLWRWKPGPPRFYSVPDQPDGIQGIAEGDDNALLIGTVGGVKRLAQGKIEAYRLPGNGPQFGARRFLRDHDGGLWIGTLKQGLLHVHQGRTDVFSSPDGLSDDDVYSVFEDREGSIWVSTISGLDRFRDFAVGTFSKEQGLPNPIVVSVLAARDGSIWLGTRGGLDRWNDGQIRAHPVSSYKRGGRPISLPNSLFQDSSGRIWVSTLQGVGYLKNDQFIPVNGIPGGNVLAMTEDAAGSLWVLNEVHGLFKLDRGEVQQIPWTRLGHKDHASTLIVDPLRGGLWLGFQYGGVVYFENGGVREGYTATNGLGEGRVNALQFDRYGTLWAATDRGLSRLKNGRMATLSSKNGLPCDTVHWAMEDANSFWLYTSCGLVRIDRSELDLWVAAVEKDKYTSQKIQATVFDGSDGVRALRMAGHYSPQAARTPDGRIWFLPWDGVSVVDPRHLPFNKLPPPVHIEQIIADRKMYDPASYAEGQVTLPARIRDLQIEYTALSLVAPEKVRFRYKLEGRDGDWQEAGNRRQAFYTDLPPRNYRFRVMACNNSGVWNEIGAFLDFSIAPAYYQTNGFRALLFAAFLGLFWALYQIRLRRLAREFNAGLEARVNERTRIARELHDTLLQSFQGLLMRFQAVSNELPDGEAKQELDGAIGGAARAITEGRDAVQGLRSSAVESNDLAAAIAALAKELPAADSQSPEFTVQVEGAVRKLHPVLRDEVYRVAGEALRNAFHHADAEHIEVEIRYDERRFRLRVRDDGKGIDPKVLVGNGRAGHFGLHGMRERASRVGGKLTVWSSDPRTDGGLQSGTEVELSIPAARAYKAVDAAGRGSWLARKLSGKDRETGS